ncbi:MAG TPA: ABC transporter permease subunit [Thermoanaerobaculia bacterium]|nr:ABC transporter permease subunit [Thermoanaerobaculia bacterium]
MPRPFRFGPAAVSRPPLSAADLVIVAGLGAVLALAIRLAWRVPAVVAGPEISLSGWALPWYALLSTSRMAAAYVLSLLFSLAYGYFAARSARARKVLMPLLDILQSVPILSFLPVVLLGLSAVLPQGIATELAAIILIFTSQAWNMTYSFYQSVTTVPQEIREAAAIFRLSPWLRFRVLELPFAAVGLIWNSMMSWAGGWFFLMAAEIFKVGSRDFRLPGLGAYLQTAADANDLRAVAAGVLTLVLTIVLLDQLLWRPILAWADKFKVEMVSSDAPPLRSWFFGVLNRSHLIEWLRHRFWAPLTEALDRRAVLPAEAGESTRTKVLWRRLGAGLAAALGVSAAGGLLYGVYRAIEALAGMTAAAWGGIGTGVLATFGRVVASLILALLWTIPVGVAIGTNRRLAGVLQPVVQVVASIPATALFPVLVLALLRVPGGLNLAAVVLMLAGTQWYLLFNVIAGTAAIPQDLRDSADLLRLSRWQRWRTLTLPALFPFLVTGAITAGGGAWNASIVAEYVTFGGKVHSTTGIGALIAQATATSDYRLLLASTLAMILAVVGLNRTWWRWLYHQAEVRFKLE